MNRLIGVLRLARLVAHCLKGFCTLWLVFPKLSLAQREKKVAAWAQGVLARLNVDLRVVGQPGANGAVMLVANHSSWLDIAAIHARIFSHFVAKHELRHWPAIGLMAARSGTLFLERLSSRDAFRVVHQIAKCLRDGEVVALFPEGTTGKP